VTTTSRLGRLGPCGESEGVRLTPQKGLSQGMADELGFPRTPKRADDPSRGLVAREALDVAHYITDMTAQLEAMAVAARLDLLAYFLGMAKAESELFVRTNTVAEAEREAEVETEAEAEAKDSYAKPAGQPYAGNSFD